MKTEDWKFKDVYKLLPWSFAKRSAKIRDINETELIFLNTLPSDETSWSQNVVLVLIEAMWRYLCEFQTVTHNISVLLNYSMNYWNMYQFSVWNYWTLIPFIILSRYLIIERIEMSNLSKWKFFMWLILLKLNRVINLFHMHIKNFIII